jgi:hypothetical protein
MQMMALYRPRVFIIGRAAPFPLLGQHFASLGLSVNRSRSPNADVSLHRPCQALKLLEGAGASTRRPASRRTRPSPSAGGRGRRDRLGEMGSPPAS